MFNGNAGGSATLVGVSQGRGLLLSVWHVFEDGVRSPVCRFPDSTKRIRCHVLALDQHLDLAAIESDSIEGTSTAFRVRAVRRDDGALQAVGYPFYARDESGPHFTKGRFLRMDGDNLLAAFKPCVHSGFSGGGVFSLRWLTGWRGEWIQRSAGIHRVQRTSPLSGSCHAGSRRGQPK